MQTVILKSSTTTPYLRRQTILRSISSEQQQSVPEQIKNVPTEKLSDKPPDICEQITKKSLEIDSERFSEHQNHSECFSEQENNSEHSAERFLEHSERTSKHDTNSKPTSEHTEPPERSMEHVQRFSGQFLNTLKTKEYFNANEDDEYEPADERKIVLNPKELSERDLEIRKSNKELLEKYGWKEEYNYFGFKFRAPLIWFNIIMITLLHIVAVYSYWHNPARGHWRSVAWAVFMGGVAGFGVTAGVHRLWCHRAYKAKLPLRIFLAICFSAAGQNTIPEWVRDHRVHHKYSETDADPHNSNRGFFFAHVGWLMMKKHPAVLEKGKALDMSDINNDPLIQLHTKYFVLLKIIFCFLLPTLVPVYFWNEDFLYTFYVQCIIRYTCSLNFTWSVNSLAHLYGKRPYDKRINPVENRFVAFIAMGEGWHNYHHAFPWDYKAAELAYTINITTLWIDLFAKLGLAYDRKQPSLELVKTISVKHGDGTHSEWGHQEVPDPYTKNIENTTTQTASDRNVNERLL